jgi:hypothetical protein
MTEDEYLDTVERIQKAMAVEPFQPSVIDVVKLLSDWRTLRNEIKRLRALVPPQDVADDEQHARHDSQGNQHL